MTGDHDSAVDREQAPQTATVQPGPGSRLAKARAAANMTVEEVATNLNLTLGAVRALERDATDELPPPVFVRGYIKNYARLVGLRGDDLVAQYEGTRAPDIPLELRPRPAAATQQIRRGLSLRAVLLAVVVVAAAVVGLWWFQGGQLGVGELTRALQPAPAPAPLPAESSPAPAPPERAADPDTATAPAGATVERGTTAAAAPEAGSDPTEDSVVTAAPAPEAAPETAAPAVPPPPTTERQLQLRLSDDAWVEIIDNDGQRLVFDMLRAGTTRQVAGEPPFLVLLGKAGAVAVELGGRAVDHTAFERKGIARFVLDDDDGNIVTREP
jgi:cytoskeleton protein RodZ